MYNGPLLVSVEEISNTVLINADPQVNSLSRTAWQELLPGFWKLAEDVISHQSCDIDRELGKNLFLCGPERPRHKFLASYFPSKGSKAARPE